jgi:hypothetical protein
VSGSVFSTVAGSDTVTFIAIDGVSTGIGVYTSPPVANYYVPISPIHLTGGQAEGYHYATLLGSTNASSTATWRGAGAPATTLMTGVSARG